MKISACMIVKNNAATIERALKSMIPHIDELIVVDTGSTDGTQEICRKFGARVEEPDPILFMTPDETEDGKPRIDFAANRNVAASYATGDWILILDSDEAITEHEGKLRDYCKQADKTGVDMLAFRLHVLTNVNGADMEKRTLQYRMHRNVDSIQWAQPVHNQLVGGKAGEAIPFTVQASYRDDYDDKLARSVPMLKKLHAMHPGSAHAPYFLARAWWDLCWKTPLDPEMSVELWRMACLNVCRQYAENVLEISDTEPGHCDAWGFLIWTTLHLDDIDAAERQLANALGALPDAPDLRYIAVGLAMVRWSKVAGGRSDVSQLASSHSRDWVANLPKAAQMLGYPANFDIG